MNLVRPDGTIWPLGAIMSYENPVYKIKDKTYSSLDEIADSTKSKSQKKP